MALHIEDPEVERLARELGERRGVSVEDALREALTSAVQTRTQIVDAWFEARMRPIIPPFELGRTLSKAEEEALLGMED